jgi:transposase-like protein
VTGRVATCQNQALLSPAVLRRQKDTYIRDTTNQIRGNGFMVEHIATAEPKTLVDAIRHYADLDIATKEFSVLRWPVAVICPYCHSKESFYAPGRRIWKCKSCRKQFSPKVGTVCEDSAIGLDKWLTAMWMIANDKNGVSSMEIHRGLGVTQKTAWFMLQRVQLEPL